MRSFLVLAKSFHIASLSLTFTSSGLTEISDFPLFLSTLDYFKDLQKDSFYIETIKKLLVNVSILFLK